MFLGYLFEVLLHHAHCMGVTVAVGVAQQAAVLADEGEVDAPGIDTYRGNLDTFAGHNLKSADDFVVQGIDIPEEVSASLNDMIGESGEFA